MPRTTSPHRLLASRAGRALRRVAVALAALACVVPWSAAEAQDHAGAATAADVAAQVQSFYDQTTTVRTSFRQTHRDRLYQRTTRSRGVLTLARPGKLRFDYLAGDGKVVISDGRELTVYEPGDEGTPGQYARTPLREDFASALGFLTGTARLDRDFRYRLVDASRYRWRGHVLELRPRRDEPGYRRVLLFVRSDATARGVVQTLVIEDHAGNTNRFDFDRPQFNRPVSASAFAFTPPAGARRI
jgi:outer membrane lipoprotein carrier protein